MLLDFNDTIKSTTILANQMILQTSFQHRFLVQLNQLFKQYQYQYQFNVMLIIKMQLIIYKSWCSKDAQNSSLSDLILFIFI